MHQFPQSQPHGGVGLGSGNPSVNGNSNAGMKQIISGLGMLQHQHQHSQSSQPHPHQSAVGSNSSVAQPRFDSSEFPALGDAIHDQQSDIAALALAAQHYGDDAQTPASRLLYSDFVPNADEFPALAQHNSKQQRNSSTSNASDLQSASNFGNRMAKSTSFSSETRPFASQTSQHASNQSNTQRFGPPPAPPAAERFGLSGLLPVIRMTDPDLNMLALGTDLTTLGLNLNSTEMMYATFAYPCAADPARSEADHVLPSCYYLQPPALKTSHLAKFTLETLFYIFYNMPKDTLQVYAGKELYNRDWRYHKDLKLWFTRSGDAQTNNAQNQQADAYMYFDIEHWERRIFRDSRTLHPTKFMSEAELQQL